MTDAPPPYPGITGYTPGTTNGAAAVGAGGFVTASASPAMSSADAKAAEAAASGGQVRTGYYDPTNAGTAFLPSDLPPSYSDAQKKND